MHHLPLSLLPKHRRRCLSPLKCHANDVGYAANVTNVSVLWGLVSCPGKPPVCKNVKTEQWLIVHHLLLGLGLESEKKPNTAEMSFSVKGRLHQD